MTEKKLDGRTRRAADIALAKRAISRASYDAILAEEVSLARAKELGRDRGPTGTTQGRSGPGTATETAREGQEQPANAPQDSPPQPVSRISKDEATQECWCGCQQLTSPNHRWLPGHDQRAKGIIKRAVREGKAEELSDRL